MNSKKIQADFILLIVALIWGFAFVAQRLGVEFLGPFGFNACRFLLGACSLLPLLYFFKTKTDHCPTTLMKSGFLAGVILFAGASFQQAGLVFTTAGNAGFITGLYIIFVPLLGLLVGQLTTLNTWVGAAVAVIGLYFLSFHELSKVNIGDVLELLGAVCWAAHVLLIAKLAPKVDNLRLAISQFLVCASLSGIVALFLEADSFTFENAARSWAPIAYAGLISVGIAYTLQIVAQKHAPPAHAAIIMSLEAVAAAFGGWLILNEQFRTAGMIGCTLMLFGMLLSQLPGVLKWKKKSV
ncbi:DMT family transporter [Neptuniibacter sp.]|uniref:DMT family transporter n=1 Tax=Neptuniibacter sp. TaxID=1962643 RepID=UPI00261860E6|nr:DMT family transporter [Neptuniibacter sp.]MCP4596262.1 DMT family transporter [Neptuniibacter sp.]